MSSKRATGPSRKPVVSRVKATNMRATPTFAQVSQLTASERGTSCRATEPLGFAVVAIGAAPNDTSALTELVANVSNPERLCLIVAPGARGLSTPDQPLVFPSSLIVADARPEERLAPNHVYVTPHDRPVAVKGGRFLFPPEASSPAVRPPLDFLFASLAEELGPRAIAVLLSSPSWGSVEGLRAIKNMGGTIIVQDPTSAVFDEAPREAIASGVADHVLPPAAIGRELSRAAKAQDQEEARATSDTYLTEDTADDTEVPDQAFRWVLALLKDRLQIDFGHYKLTTIRRRVERRMALCHFEHMAAYAEHLRSNPEAVKELHDEIFIHVTQFFRDPRSFEALRNLVFPALLKGRTDENPIRIWVPGCSTGEEAYSIAIALTEFLERQGSSVNFQIFATDISDIAIRHARRAIYPASLLKDLGSQRVERFFESVMEGYKVRNELRELCIISRHDMTSNPPFARLDLISCRNVLIYFGRELQKRVVPIFHYALKPGGFLWLGQSETPGASSKLFSLVDKQHKIYAKATTSPPYLELASSSLVTEKLRIFRSPLPEAKTDVDFHKSADQLVLVKYGPPGVVVNHEFEILQFRGKTAPYLEPAAGQPTHNLLKMARRDLLPVLRPLLQGAKKQNLPVRKERVFIEDGGARRALNLEVAPLNPLAPERDRRFLVLFEPMRERGKANKQSSPKRANERVAKWSEKSSSKDRYIDQLQQELDTLRDYQKALIEQFESSQEELTSANEELQATNEEVQSTNEELETAKEELQSANEELTTMNDELQSRNEELVSVNEKLARGENRFRLMVESVKDYAIYMLDPEGRVTSWNQGARRLKGYEPSEIIGEDYSRFFLPEDVAAEAPRIELERARIDGRFEAEAWRLRKDGSRFWANVTVTRINDTNGALIGFAKVTRDLTERKRSDEQLERSEQRFRLMISGVRDYAIFMLDPEWRVASWNEGARRLKGYEEPEILGKHFSVFYPPEDVAKGKIEREIEAVMAEGWVEDEGWRVRKDGTRFWGNVVITRVNDAQGNLVGFTKVTRDLTESKKADEELRRVNERLELRVQERTKELEQALKTRDDFLSIASHELKTPLTGLKLQLQMALRTVRRDAGKPFPAEHAGTTFERALRQAVALDELIEDLLDVSRVQTGRLTVELEDVGLSGLIEEVAARFSDQLAHAGAELVLDLQAGVRGCWDRRRIAQVFTNLLSNALKYAPKSPIRLSMTSYDGLANIVVADSGPGISPERQSTIFERFERAGASPNIGGLGLGLFIARRIVEAHQGSIRVESQVGKGTRFVVELPLRPSRASFKPIST